MKKKINKKVVIKKKVKQKIEVKKTLIEKFPLSDESIGKLYVKNKIEKMLLEIFNGSDDMPDSYPDQFGIMDPANVCMVYAKSKDARQILTRFYNKYDFDYNHKIPELDYVQGLKESTSKYSTEYLNKIMKIICEMEDSCRISVGKDFPMKIENKHFVFLLAPRVESD